MEHRFDGLDLLNNVIPNIKGGDIIMFQNNSKDTVEALPEILKTLKDRNYQCDLLSDLLYDDTNNVNSNGVLMPPEENEK